MLSTEKDLMEQLGQKIKIPFTNLEVPWAIQISCAYFGLSIQTACCILGSFDVGGSPNSSNMQTWKLSFTEYDLGQLRKKLMEEIKKARTTQTPISKY